MKLKSVFFILMGLLISVPVWAQRSKKAEKAFNASREAFVQRDYESALRHVEKALKMSPSDAESWLLQAEIAIQVRNVDLSLTSYEQSLACDSMFFPPMSLSLARLYDEKMRYRDEIQLLEWFQDVASGNRANDDMATAMLEAARFRAEAVEHPVEFHPESLGENVNTVDDEYVNTLELGGEALLFTRRFLATKDRYQQEGIFQSSYWDGQWHVPNQLSVDSNLDNHIGAAFITYGGDRLYFTACGVERHNETCDLYTSMRTAVDADWQAPFNMGSVNDPAWDSQPCLSLDGKELFFSSRRGGNADLYHCYLREDGNWSSPESLGSVLNTSGTEMAPFLHPDGKTLYFSSDTHVGMGGFDLFMSRRDASGAWSEPVNLGYPINTPGDEINFIVASDGRTAYLSSIRDGGFGGYDIYTFQLPEEIRPEATNPYDFFAEECEPGTVISLRKIQFDYNSAILTPSSEEGVQILWEFLNRHPEIQVELSGHTDNVGGEAYNLRLSQERADAVRDALIQRGVEAERLTSKGYGASKPLYPNDNEEHRAMNRRTEMTIL